MLNNFGPTNLKDFDSPFIHATLVKRGISTFEACEVFGRENGIPYADISTCGLKDTLGMTSQLVCIRNRPNLTVSCTEFGNFFLRDFKPSDRKLEIGSHEGNSFVIRVRDIAAGREEAEDVLSRFKSAAGSGLPNFYGPQRFGVRQDNHILGKMLLKKDYDGFIRKFLTYTKNESRKTMIVRSIIERNYEDWGRCLEAAKVGGLTDETTVLSSLASGENAETAIRKMKLSNFFVHSYSSYLFNMALSNALKGGRRNFSLEKIGSSTKFDGLNKAAYTPIMEKEGVSLDDFRNSGFEVRGHPRNALFFPKDFSYRFEGKDLILSFGMGKGEYASLLLDFLIDSGVRKLC